MIRKERKKIKEKIFLPVIMLFFSLLLQAQEDRKVAVFDPAGTIDKTLLEIVREEISSAVVNTKGYTVLERQLINKVMEESEFQASGLVSDAQVSDIGRLMGADYVFVSTVSILGNNYYISCKMIEVATARIDKQFTGTTTDGMNDIPQTAQFVVRRMFGENVKPIAGQTGGRQQQTTANEVETTGISKRQNAEYQLSDDCALLHLYRPSSVVGTLIRYNLYLDNDMIFLVKNKSKTTVRITNEGLKTLWAKDESKTELPIDIRLGREYYIRCGLGTGPFVGKPRLEIVDNEKGKVEFVKIH
ncbi:MAG: hypothetical protein LBE56_14615 [Tannerella sp.]|jgi:hypothetical protein|nr:hypothetical protein [Tannerella sp.]